MLKDLQRLYEHIGICSKINSDGKKQKTHHSERFKLNVLKSGECAKLAFYIYPYLLHPVKKEKIASIFKDEEILSSIRINDRKSLLNEFRDTYHIKRTVLPLYLLHKLKYQVAHSTVNGWLGGVHRLPLSVILHCCKELDKDYFNHIPREYAFLLSTLNVIPYKQFIELRKRFKD